MTTTAVPPTSTQLCGVFADVNAELIDALAAADSYDVHLVGEESQTKTVTGFRAINSATDEEALVAEAMASWARAFSLDTVAAFQTEDQALGVRRLDVLYNGHRLCLHGGAGHVQRALEFQPVAHQRTGLSASGLHH